MTSSGLGLVLIGAALVVCVVSLIRYRLQLTFADVAMLTLSAAGNALRGDWVWASVSAAVLVWTAHTWWNRRKRRRAPRTLGAKSRARIAAMTARMRERPARPVLRPVPGGAR